MLMTRERESETGVSSAPEMRARSSCSQTGICVGSAYRWKTVRGETHSISSDAHESRMDPILTPGKKLFLLYLLFFILLYQGKQYDDGLMCSSPIN